MYLRYSAVLPPLHPLVILSKLRGLVRPIEICYIMEDSSENFLYDTLFQVLRELGRPIVYSLSPGTSVTPAMAKDISGLVNMYRITADDWDNWGDVKTHFDVTRWLNCCILV